MTFANAKKLHNEDEIIVKRTGEVLTVLSTEIKEKTVIVLCDDGNEYYHQDIK